MTAAKHCSLEAVAPASIIYLKSSSINMETKSKQKSQTHDGDVWKQLTSTVLEIYHDILSSKPNRLILTADLTAVDIAIGFPAAAKVLYEIDLHNPVNAAPYLNPIILLSSTLISGAIAFYLYEKALYRLSKLKRSGKGGKVRAE